MSNIISNNKKYLVSNDKKILYNCKKYKYSEYPNVTGKINNDKKYVQNNNIKYY
jgi:hypothetical protein